MVVTRRDVCHLRVTLPSGDAMVRRFLPEEPCRVLRDVLLVVLDEVEALDEVREGGFRVSSRASRKALRLGDTRTQALVQSGAAGGSDATSEASQDLDRSLKDAGLWPNDSLQVQFVQKSAADGGDEAGQGQ